MARTAAGRRLTDQHRIAQVRLAAAAALDAQRLWDLLDPDRLEATTPGWLTAVLAVIQQRRTQSEILAAAYLSAFRFVEVGQPLPTTPATIPLDRVVVATSLAVTGPVRIRRAIRRSQPIERARNIALVETARAASRHALNGGRELITQATGTDPRARGWARVTSGNACGFCSSLAGRGAVYTEASGGFQAHDGCHCSVEPAYT